jgi:hypothetical protein
MPDIKLGYYRGSLERLLEALEAARIEDAVLGLDGDADELHELVDQRTSQRPDLVETNRLRRDGRRRFRLLGGDVVLGASRTSATTRCGSAAEFLGTLSRRFVQRLETTFNLRRGLR